MYRDALVELPMDEQVVDPSGVDALEEVVGRHDAEVVLEPEEARRGSRRQGHGLMAPLMTAQPFPTVVG